ncbi:MULTISPECIES: FkbM family methyltransferase [unclassified Leptolyngbya]|uniref:FkbM family methyltransferase n=1 Tax=unclassified Leptolyngbya TaxID=2650499 RepID=UPI00168348DD|nr:MULTISPECIES: FkbM family methyltransferase [unclassified Leptolyngbya]MBD1910494.1 FkbM family methyltransferase [Leptolyngbya sp. FACHB-8]MBD2153661.1 FkbM family methyltransferase [Leptolyngbya sp. FACHB-16]
MTALLRHLKQRGHLDGLHFNVCSVGARKVADGDDFEAQGWGIFAPHLTVYGFDADADACDIASLDFATRHLDWQEHYVPLALSDTAANKALYVTQDPMCTSLYPPNEPLLARFEKLPEFMNLDFALEVETTTLDAFCEAEQVPFIDFLQIDVQGADLHVLHGARQLLSTVLMIQIEVEFAPLYENQPLFADIDTFLRLEGFSLFDLIGTRCKRAHSPIFNRNRPGQLLWGEAFYLRDPLLLYPQESKLSSERTLKLACIAFLSGFLDFAFELLEHLTLTVGQSDPRYNFTAAIEDFLLELNMSNDAIANLRLMQNLRSA